MQKESKMQKTFIVITIVFALFICWILFMADTKQNTIFFDLVKAIPMGDKIGHFFLFGLLTLGINLSLKCKKVKIWNYSILLGSILVFMFTTIEELSQMFFSNRTLDITDFLANTIGIIVFSYISLWKFKK